MASFVWPVRVYYEDTDAGGVVFYANYLKFMERARTEWLRSLGFEQDRLMQDPGLVFAVRDVKVHFHRPARFNDELLVTANIVRSGKASLGFDQTVVKDNDARSLLCSGRVDIVCLDAASFRPRAIPEFMQEKLLRTS